MPYPNWDRHVLQFLGAFSALQDSIDDLARDYFARRLGDAVANVIDKRWLKRVQDEVRPDLVLTIADGLASTMDLINFKRTYNRLGDVRDLISHSSGVVTAWSADGWRLAVTHKSGDRRAARLPPTIDELFLQGLHADCMWLGHFVVRLNWECGQPMHIARGVTLVPVTGVSVPEATPPSERAGDLEVNHGDSWFSTD